MNPLKKIAFLLFICVAFLCNRAYSANVTWTGNAGDGYLTTGGNWSSNSVPGAGDTLYLGSKATVVSNTNNAGLAIGTLYFAADAVNDVTFQLTKYLRFQAGITVDAGFNYNASVTIASYQYLKMGPSPFKTTGTFTITNNSSHLLTISGAGSLQAMSAYTGYTPTLELNIGGAGSTTISCTISMASPTSSTMDLNKSGVGTLTLEGANSYNGVTSVQGGVLSFNSVASGTNAQALGINNTVNLGVAATSSGTLQYTGAAGTLDKNVFVLGNGINTIKNTGTGLLVLSGSLVKNGTILALDGGANGINVTGVISGTSATATSDLYVTGGSVTLSNVNTYSGPTYVYGNSTLINGVAGSLPTDTVLYLGSSADNSTGTLDLDGHSQTIAGLVGYGTGSNVVTNNGGGNSTLTVTNGGTFNGQIKDGTGSVGLTVAGDNLVLGGSNSYAGATNITSGTLTVNGSLAATSEVSISSGAVLSGSGNVKGSVSGTGATINGSGLNLGATTLNGSSKLSGYNIASSVTVAGGTTSLTGTTKSASALTVSSGATFNNNGTVDGSVNINGGLIGGNGAITQNLALASGTLSSTALTTVGGDFSVDKYSTLIAEVMGTEAGTSYGQVKVSGNVSLAGTLDLTSLTGLSLNDKVVLVNNTSKGNTTTGFFESIVTRDGTYTPGDAVTSYTFSVGGTEYLLSYSAAGTDGYANDIVLSVVPEPGTWALFAGGLGMLAFGQRIRRKIS